MKTLVNHKGLQLQDAAADSLARFEQAHGVQPITSAYRSPAQQQALINRWNKGGPANRPPYLYEPASIKASKHVPGLAVDTNNPDVFHAYGADYGWLFNFAYDKVHFEYNAARDKHKGSPKPTPPKATPAKPGHVTAVTSAIVRAVQSKLRKVYPAYAGKLAVDGVDGPATRAAVREFQRRSGLTPDGIIGPKTLARLGL